MIDRIKHIFFAELTLANGLEHVKKGKNSRYFTSRNFIEFVYITILKSLTLSKTPKIQESLCS